MLKTFSAIAAAALIAAVIAVLPGFSTAVDASTPVAALKGDRLDIRPIGKDCSQQAWPYFENTCLRNSGNRTMPRAAVRVVSVERR